jgi:hypothetical protein
MRTEICEKLGIEYPIFATNRGQPPNNTEQGKHAIRWLSPINYGDPPAQLAVIPAEAGIQGQGVGAS